MLWVNDLCGPIIKGYEVFQGGDNLKVASEPPNIQAPTNSLDSLEDRACCG